jgi:thiol:disulfide interchange protein
MQRWATWLCGVLASGVVACEVPAPTRAGSELGKSPALLASEGKPVAHGPSAQGKPAIYDEQADHEAALAQALEQARREHKRVLVTFGGNWCGWCHALHELFEAEGPVRERLATSYVQLRVDSRSGKALAVELGAPLPSVPFLTVLDADGKALVHQETGALELGQGHDPGKVRAFLDRYRAPG